MRIGTGVCVRKKRRAVRPGGGSIMTRFIMVSAQYNKTGFVIIKKDTTGYTITCRIPDGQTDLFSFSLHLPDKLQAEIVKENFYNDPETVYKAMLAILTKDKELTKEIFKNHLN